MNKLTFYACLFASGLFLMSCSDDNNSDDETGDLGEKTDSAYTGEDLYAGGKLGTAFNSSANAYQEASPAVENANMVAEFFKGERLFERDFNQTEGSAFYGLGPLYVRKGCLYCHPSYGHGKRQTEYKESTMGNGYLLVLYENVDGKSTYLSSLTGMPQTGAVMPFKSPIDESKIKIEWKKYTDEWGNKFSDGETYELIYPEVTIPASAYYVPLKATVNGVANTELTVDQVGIRLESTIGIYGSGLIDAIPDDSIVAQWVAESPYCTLNPAYFDQSTNTWINYYKGLTGKQYVRRLTYAMSRGPVLDGPGSNAIWNITNVTRSDRKYHYMTADYAKVASQDPDVQKEFYTYFPNEKTDKGVEYDIYRYLTGKEDGKNIATPEMSDADYKALMIWHRGLAVPAARNMGDKSVQQGKKLFAEIGCTQCHRPSWITGDDNIEDPNGMFTNSDMPRYPHQKIWPYTDMVQHRLYMQNDIRTGWCRTTPLWGRGLSKVCTGAEDRLHDCRARNVVEAIMWHGSKDSDARKSVEAFRKLSKTEREAVVKFINAI